MVTENGGNGERSNTLISDIVRFACTGVLGQLKQIMDANTVGYFPECKQKNSAVVCIQFYRYNFEAYIAASSLKVYALHISPLIISDKKRKKLIFTGKTTIVYLPMTFKDNDDASEATCKVS